MLKLNKSNTKLINYLLKDMSGDSNQVNLITSNLNNLLNTYFFKDKEKVINNINKPKIYLYNTHNLEKYNDDTSIYTATKLLKNNLERLNVNVIQEESKTSELITTGLSYYNVSREFILNKMKDKSIAYYIDIHRDSASDTKVTINNKKYAKILFVLGLDNPNYQKNKEILLKMNDYLNKNYPGISKGIYEKKGSGVDGVYNQDLNENVLLIELGGVTNNYEEVNNSTEILALMLL